jgi:hypothetical protein
MTVWHDREMFGGHDGVRVDGYHNDGFNCLRRSASATCWYVTVGTTGGATDRPVASKRGLIGGSGRRLASATTTTAGIAGYG